MKKFKKPSQCPSCGKKINKEQYRHYPKETFDMVIHETRPDPMGHFLDVTESCIIRKEL